MVCKSTTFDGRNEQDWSRHNWNEDVLFRAEHFFEPSHSAADVNDGLEQLVHVVARATEENRPLHALGAGWAFEDLAGTDAWEVSLAKLDRQLGYVVEGIDGTGPGLTDAWRAVQTDANAGTRLVHVEAGIRIATLTERLQAKGLAMPTLGGANGQALAGVISTSTHGGDWEQPPFPDLVRAVHLVTIGGRELWIERRSEPVTTDDRLRPVLLCPTTEIVRDDRIFDAVLVACGRFGVIYAVVLEVRRSFRVVEVVNTPIRDDVMSALRDGQANGTLLQPLIDLAATWPRPLPTAAGGGTPDAVGQPYFLQVVFNSQNPADVWVHRRWITTEERDIPEPEPPPVGGDRVTATTSLHDLAVEIVAAANAALGPAAATLGAIPFAGPGLALYVTGLIAYLDGLIAGRNFRFGSVMSAALDALWKVPLASHAIPALNKMVVGNAFNEPIKKGRRGPHYLITTGDRAGSDQNDFRVDSVEVVFDATQQGFLNFLDDVLVKAPNFQQAGIISIRPCRRSRASLSMHNVPGSHAVSIEIATLKFLPGNLEWMRYVHQAAVQRQGRPHWGQFNKLTELDVAMLYGPALDEWREALLAVSDQSTLFSNNFCRLRGLEPKSIARRVTGAARTRDGVTTHLCGEGASWSPVTVAQAVQQIQNGAVRYFTQDGNRLALLDVVQGTGGPYLRTRPDAAPGNNLDNLPACG